MRGKHHRDDSEIIDCIAARDQRCLELLHKRYHALVFGMAKTILRNDALAEEVTQDIFLAVWQQPEKWDPQKGRFTSWLLTVTRYTAIDRLRHEVRRPPMLESPFEDVAHVVMSNNKGDEKLRDDVSLVRQLLKTLPDEQQQVIYLAFFQGMTQAQIAEHLQWPIGTVKSRIRLGLRKLREKWREAHEVGDALETEN